MNNGLDTLTRFGPAFQAKTLACLMTDKGFLDQINDVLSEDFYDSDANKWIVEKIISYYRNYKKSPTLDFFKTELKKTTNETLELSVIEQLRKIWGVRESTDLDYVKDEFLEFAKNQKVKIAILNSVNLLQEGNYGQIRVIIDDALNAGLSKEIGHIYKEQIEDRLAESARETVPTGWSVIDELMDGGLGPGELGVCAASSGAGKSWFLAALGVAAAQQGLNVVHYTLELDETQLGLRYDSILSGYAPNEVRNHREEIIELVEALPGSVSIKMYPTKSANCNTLSAHFERQELVHGRPDLMLVDYGDLLTSSSAPLGNASVDNTYISAGNIYTQLRRLAGELRVPIWTVSQSNRSSVKEDVIEADMIADSYQKVMIADFVMSLSRKKTDKLNDTGRFHIIKNRFGQDGMTFPATFVTEQGKIIIHHPNSDSGREAMLRMNESEDDAERKALSARYAQLRSNNGNGKANGTSNGSKGTDPKSLAANMFSKNGSAKTNISL